MKQLLNTTLFTTILCLLCSCASYPKDRLTVRSINQSAASEPDKSKVISYWREIVDHANQFLASSECLTLPRGSTIQWSEEGSMVFNDGKGSLPIPVVLIDKLWTTSCICAQVDTHENAIIARRFEFEDLKSSDVEVSNTFFSEMRTRDSLSGNSWKLLHMISAIYFEKDCHISEWERFKCQWLEWIIGSGHHRQSMSKVQKVVLEYSNFSMNEKLSQ